MTIPSARTLKAASVLRHNAVGLLMLALLTVLVVVPIGLLLLASFLEETPRLGQALGSATLDNYRALAAPGNLAATRTSLVIAVTGSTGALAIGGTLAWLVTRTDIRGRLLIQVGAIAPLFVPPLVSALAWALLGSPRSGYLSIVAADLGLPFGINVYSLGGVIFVMILAYAPYTFLFVSSALTLVNPEMEEAARVHGSDDRTVVRTVTFPLIRPALLSALLLTLVLMVENFAIVQILGLPASEYALTSRIFGLMTGAPPQATAASAIGMQLLVITALLVFLANRALKGKTFTTVTGKGFRPRRIKLSRLARVAGTVVAAAYFLAAFALPTLALLNKAFRPFAFFRTARDLITPTGFTTASFSEMLSYDALWSGMKNSIMVAAAVAALAGIFHFSLALRTRLRHGPLERSIGYLVMFPAAVPGIVLGMGILWTWINVPLPVYGTIFVIVLAYIGRFLPEGYRGISSTIGQIHPDLEECALVSGATRARATLNVTLPLVMTGVVSTVLLLFVISMRELASALFLFSSRSRVLSIVLYEQWESGGWHRLSVVSIVYIVVLLVPTLASRLLAARAIGAR